MFRKLKSSVRKVLRPSLPSQRRSTETIMKSTSSSYQSYAAFAQKDNVVKLQQTIIKAHQQLDDVTDALNPAKNRFMEALNLIGILEPLLIANEHVVPYIPVANEVVGLVAAGFIASREGSEQASAVNEYFEYVSRVLVLTTNSISSGRVGEMVISENLISLRRNMLVANKKLADYKVKSKKYRMAYKGQIDNDFKQMNETLQQELQLFQAEKLDRIDSKLYTANVELQDMKSEIHDLRKDVAKLKTCQPILEDISAKLDIIINASNALARAQNQNDISMEVARMVDAHRSFESLRSEFDRIMQSDPPSPAESVRSGPELILTPPFSPLSVQSLESFNFKTFEVTP